MSYLLAMDDDGQGKVTVPVLVEAMDTTSF
jgi:hypothetical protein